MNLCYFVISPKRASKTEWIILATSQCTQFLHPVKFIWNDTKQSDDEQKKKLFEWNHTHTQSFLAEQSLNEFFFSSSIPTGTFLYCSNFSFYFAFLAGFHAVALWYCHRNLLQSIQSGFPISLLTIHAMCMCRNVCIALSVMCRFLLIRIFRLDDQRQN